MNGLMQRFALTSRERFADHSRETFDAALDTSGKWPEQWYFRRITKKK
jgi:hypothetical protein